MQTIDTRNFGPMEYEPDKTIHFPAGLPGYPQDKHYIMLAMEETDDTFFWLQSLDDGEVCFPVMNVYKALPDYDPHVNTDELSDLGDIEGASLEIYNIAVIPEDISQTRVNLRAPLIINLHTRRGKQIICANEEYAVRHLIMDQWRTAVQRAAAC